MATRKSITATLEKRATKWASEFIACGMHPERRATEYNYVHADGSPKPAVVRHWNKTGYDRIMRRRFRGFVNGNTLRGFALFERITGMNLEAL
jgi:hypothetical protein